MKHPADPTIRLNEVNAVLATIVDIPCVLSLRDDRRLVMRVERKTATIDFHPAVRGDGLWFRYHRRAHGRCGWGGTQEQAIVQLIRWFHGLPRRPLSYWWSITHPWIGLGGLTLLNALDRSSYFADRSKVSCVQCGKREPTDWCSWEKLTGPVCRHATSDGCPK